MFFSYQFQSRFSIEPDLALLPQIGLFGKERNKLVSPNEEPDQNMSGWFVLQVCPQY